MPEALFYRAIHCVVSRHQEGSQNLHSVLYIELNFSNDLSKCVLKDRLIALSLPILVDQAVNVHTRAPAPPRAEGFKLKTAHTMKTQPRVCSLFIHELNVSQAGIRLVSIPMCSTYLP